MTCVCVAELDDFVFVNWERHSVHGNGSGEMKAGGRIMIRPKNTCVTWINSACNKNLWKNIGSVFHRQETKCSVIGHKVLQLQMLMAIKVSDKFNSLFSSCFLFIFNSITHEWVVVLPFFSLKNYACFGRFVQFCFITAEQEETWTGDLSCTWDRHQQQHQYV